MMLKRSVKHPKQYGVCPDREKDQVFIRNYLHDRISCVKIKKLFG